MTNVSNNTKNNNVFVFYSNEADRTSFDETLKYWSSAAGDLHHHGKTDITEEQLPPVLQYAYNELWGEDYGIYCYLVETPKGFGIALIPEYDECFANDCELTMDELFSSAVKDAAIIAEDLAFLKADIYVAEYMGFDDCHELAVVFPADISKEEFVTAAKKLDELAYQTAKTFPKLSLSEQIKQSNNLLKNLREFSQVFQPKKDEKSEPEL